MKNIKKKIKVMASGVFDLLHNGHVYYLKEAKKLGDELIVVVASDEYVKKAKGKTMYNAETRKFAVGTLQVVDRVVVPKNIDRKEFYQTVMKLKPDIIALGYDQKFDKAELKKDLATHGWKGEVVRIGRYPREELSSRDLKKQLGMK